MYVNVDPFEFGHLTFAESPFFLFPAVSLYSSQTGHDQSPNLSPVPLLANSGAPGHCDSNLASLGHFRNAQLPQRDVRHPICRSGAGPVLGDSCHRDSVLVDADAGCHLQGEDCWQAC